MSKKKRKSREEGGPALKRPQPQLGSKEVGYLIRAIR